jgi:hypothetical protein
MPPKSKIAREGRQEGAREAGQEEEQEGAEASSPADRRPRSQVLWVRGKGSKAA